MLLYGLYVTLFVPGILNERTRISFFLFSVLSHLKTKSQCDVACLWLQRIERGPFSQFLPLTDRHPYRSSKTEPRLFADLSDQPFYYTSIKELGHKYMQMNLIWHKLTTFSGAALGLSSRRQCNIAASSQTDTGVRKTTRAVMPYLRKGLKRFMQCFRFANPR